MSHEQYWTFRTDNGVYDHDFETITECLETLDELLAEDIQENEPDLRNGDEFTQEVELIKYSYDENLERNIIFTKPITAHYVHYHGDLSEHGTIH